MEITRLDNNEKTKKKEEFFLKTPNQDFTEINTLKHDNMKVGTFLLSKSEKTRITYQRALKDFFNFYPGLGLKDIIEDHVGQYLAHIKNDKKNSTLALVKSSISSLYDFLVKNGQVEFNPTKGLSRIKVDSNKKLQNVLSKLDIEEMIKATKIKRDKSLIKFLYLTGLRVSEALNVKYSDFKLIESEGILERVEFLVLGKGNKTRKIMISEEMYLELIQQNEAKEEGVNLDQYVFLNRSEDQLSRRYCSMMVREAAVKAKVFDANNVSPHSLRHAHASHSLEAGVAIHVLQKSLGHSSITTTSVYLHAISTDFSGLKLEFSTR